MRKMGVDLHTEIPKVAIFLLKNVGSTYTRGQLIHGVDLYTVKYGNSNIYNNLFTSKSI